MTTETLLTSEQVDALLDGVLRASGSALRNYSLPKYINDMRDAVRAIEQAVLQSDEVQALCKDAERYQTIKNLVYATDLPIGEAMLSMTIIGACPNLEEFDAAIDEATEQQP